MSHVSIVPKSIWGSSSYDLTFDGLQEMFFQMRTAVTEGITRVCPDATRESFGATRKSTTQIIDKSWDPISKFDQEVSEWKSRYDLNF